MSIVCWSVKGGSGTTVTAASLARILADRSDAGALLVDTEGDSLMVLGRETLTPRGVRTWLASSDDVPPETLKLLGVDMGRGLTVLPAGDIPDRMPSTQRWEQLASYLQQRPEAVVVDLGSISGKSSPGRRKLLDSAATSLLVLRPCYLALRRATDLPLRPTGVILLQEDGRILTAHDVTAALGVPVVATVLLDQRIARLVDTGLLGNRLPRSFTRAYRRVAA
jgi:hypothetical protein